MSIFDKLKDLASTSAGCHDSDGRYVPPLDADYVKRSINLLDKGKEYGSSNIPSQNETTQDSVELDIKEGLKN